MATTADIRYYLATWFQMGKGVECSLPSGTEVLRPSSVLGAIQPYSPEFEQCWQTIEAHPGSCQLQGTTESIHSLMDGYWQIAACSRCNLPIPVQVRGARDPDFCSCVDVATLPNFETIPPRPAPEIYRSLSDLNRLRQRLD